ncbi:MAG: OmpH family outer membrane protein [Bacteroidales bacterium]|nr:OmpH family outer membrane protein [Bacteroidales bacterium]MBN2818496.1 OmpH family outer membrane protein [Bacteroidales bacterium]
MKKITPILNVVLLVAVVVLYVLHFTGSKTNASAKSGNDSTSVSISPDGIVYISIDSVFANYDMYKDVAGDLDEKLKTSEAKLQSQQRAFQKSFEDYQYKVQRGLVTRTEAEQMQQTLAQEEQNLMQLQNQLQYQLAEEQQVAQRKVLNSLMEYLKGMENADKYQFVLGNTFGGNIMYANENLDITKVVIEGINEEYKSKKDKE